MNSFGCTALNVTYIKQSTSVRALTNLDINIGQGEVVAVVGESGCGKSTLGGFFSGSLPANAQVSFESSVLPDFSSVIKQEAKSSLHPLLRVGTQLKDCVHDKCKAARLLDEVGLDSDIFYKRYPHQLSGGQAQLAVIARALATGSKFLVADEPTANLDLITQRKILRIISEAIEKYRLACLFVTHDLSAVAEIASRVVVVFEGRIIETGTPGNILNNPAEPYTKELLCSLK